MVDAMTKTFLQQHARPVRAGFLYVSILSALVVPMSGSLKARDLACKGGELKKGGEIYGDGILIYKNGRWIA